MIRARQLLAPLLVALLATRAGAQTLGIAGDRFTIDGKPRFLTVISYFDALRSENLEADLDFIRNELGFDGIRVFPNWWVYDREKRPCPVAADDTLFEASGRIRGDATPASGPLARLLGLVHAAAKRGLVVDLSFARETVAGEMSVPAYRSALQRIAFLLRGQRHVLFDLQNERDLDCPAMHLTPAQVRDLREAVKDRGRGDPARLVVASTTGSSPPIAGNLDDPAGTVGFVRTVGLDATAFHDPRGPGWHLRGTRQSCRRYAAPASPCTCRNLHAGASATPTRAGGPRVRMPTAMPNIFATLCRARASRERRRGRFTPSARSRSDRDARRSARSSSACRETPLSACCSSARAVSRG